MASKKRFTKTSAGKVARGDDADRDLRNARPLTLHRSPPSVKPSPRARRRRLYALFTFATVAGLAAGSAPAARAESTGPAVTIPAGTLVPVLLDRELRPDDGPKLTTLELATDVVVDGRLVLQRADTVDGRLRTERVRTQRLGAVETATTLVLDVDRAISFCGDVVALRFERTLRAGARELGGLRLPSRAADFERGSVLAARTATTQRLCTPAGRASPAPVPETMILPDGSESRIR